MVSNLIDAWPSHAIATWLSPNFPASSVPFQFQSRPLLPFIFCTVNYGGDAVGPWAQEGTERRTLPVFMPPARNCAHRMCIGARVKIDSTHFLIFHDASCVPGPSEAGRTQFFRRVLPSRAKRSAFPTPPPRCLSFN